MKKFFRVPPAFPILFTLIAGVIHSTIWAFEPLNAPWNFISGGFIIAIAILMFAVSVLTFRKHGESFDIRRPTSQLVTDGIYSSSRNPAYLAMMMMIFGVGCLTNSLAIILAIVPTFIAFNWYTVPREERYLNQNLGYEYEEYKNRVRRWL